VHSIIRKKHYYFLIISIITITILQTVFSTICV